MISLVCTRAIIDDSVGRLRRGGLTGHERVVLWLARAGTSVRPEAVHEVYEPDQRTAEDFFHLPSDSVRALLAHLRSHRLKVAAQVHTHPGAAFHSKADDRWAIVRQRGALSLVLPRFAATTSADNFLDEAAIYMLSAEDKWERAPGRGAGAPLEVVS